MSISDKIIQLNQVKQDIKQAIEDKGVAMSGVPFVNYPLKISEISGGGVVDEYFYYSKAYYTITNNSTLFSNAWQKQIDSKNVIYDIDVTLAAPNQDMGGMYVDLYIGDSDLTQLYNDCLNEVIPLPSNGNLGDIYLINNVAVKYYGDISGDVGFPIPLFEFGSMEDVHGFIIGDLTPLGMGLGIVLAKITSVTIPNNKLTIQQGFDFEEPFGIILPNSVLSIGGSAFDSWSTNNQPLVIPNSVLSIGKYAFYDWYNNNQPLMIPNSVIIIVEYAFDSWTSNNQPLVIGNSVTIIGNQAFYGWTANNQPLVIPDSVISIGNSAFNSWSNVTYVEMKSETPPTLASSSAFNNQNNAPIYVPDASLNAYKNATNWTVLASRIFPISEKLILIPYGTIHIDDYAYNGLTSYNNLLIIPDTVITIGVSAFGDWWANNHPLVIGNSVTTIGEYAFSEWRANDQHLVIPDSVISIGNSAFKYWSVNKQPLVIGNSVTTIGDEAFRDWTSNNQPLVIPNSVTNIGEFAFYKWETNSYPLVIPDSVTFIGRLAFGSWNSTPYAEIHATTPPTLEYGSLDGSYPIYVPDGSVDDYKTASTNWSSLASRIFSINEK